MRLGRLILPSFAALLLAAGSIDRHTSAQDPGAWRSSLYPNDWRPGMRDAAGRFLHDFSYAGYRAGAVAIPDAPPGTVLDASKPPYVADATGLQDATVAIQSALDAAGSAGGGIVYLPPGTYSVKPQGANTWALRISKSRVVLRGAGATQTRLYLDRNALRDGAMILVAPTGSRSWTTPIGSQVSIAADLLEPTATIPLAAPPPWQPGDWVMVRADVTPEFIAEHGMGALWNTAMDPQLYYRRVVAVDVPAQTITLDAPTRYALKTRDNARVYQVAPHLEEVGVEHLAMGMKENLAPGLGDQDYTVPGTAAYDAHASKAILYDHVVNGWIREVKSYRPETNTQDWHTLSNGVELNRSRFVTVAGCHFAKPQYRGAGGNGYAYNHGGNDCLITRSTGEKGRHNFSFKTLLASGSVIHRSTAIDGLLPSDFHRHLTVAGLVDNLTLVRDFFEARLRPFGNPPLHGHSAAQSVFWNLTGQEASPGNPFVVLSSQFGWGYVIGTRGSVTGVQVTPQAGAPDAGTEPVDYVEGVGLGGGLVPESLYEDQLARRRPKVGDFDGDRRADVLWRKVAAGVDKGAMFLWTMHGTGLAGARYLDPISEDWQVQFMGDFNGDGKGDVLWRNMNAASADAGKLYLWMMNGPFVAGGTGYTASQADLGWRVDGVGDLNGDGKSDIVWRKTAAGVDKGAVFLWPMNGTGIVGPRYLDPISEDWQVVDLGDFNGDGKADVLWRNMNAMSPDAGKLYIWMMDGANVIAGTGYTASQADLGWRVDGVGDLNGDGKDDIVWRKIGAGVDKGAVFLWTMNGTGFAGARYLDPIGEDWQVQGVGDFNGDGKTDILWRNQGPGTDIGNLYIWMMDGPNVVGGTGYTAAQADLGWRVDSPKK